MDSIDTHCGNVYLREEKKTNWSAEMFHSTRLKRTFSSAGKQSAMECVCVRCIEAIKDWIDIEYGTTRILGTKDVDAIHMCIDSIFSKMYSFSGGFKWLWSAFKQNDYDSFLLTELKIYRSLRIIASDYYYYY